MDFTTENTQLKQQHFQTFLRVHMDVVKRIFAKFSRTYWGRYLYIDLNGGPGEYVLPDGQTVVSSSLYAVQCALTLNLALCAYVTEKDRTIFERLSQAFEQIGLYILRSGPEGMLWTSEVSRSESLIQCWLLNEDYLDLFPSVLERESIHKPPYGLIYSDECGVDIPFPLLRTLSHQFKRVDLLIHCTANGRKRYNGFRRLNNEPLLPPLDREITQLLKQTWHVRIPYTAWQWTFFFGTNWDNPFQLKKQGFHGMDSPEGLSILKKLTLTEQERNQDQPDFFEE